MKALSKVPAARLSERRRSGTRFFTGNRWDHAGRTGGIAHLGICWCGAKRPKTVAFQPPPGSPGRPPSPPSLDRPASAPSRNRAWVSLRRSAVLVAGALAADRRVGGGERYGRARQGVSQPPESPEGLLTVAVGARGPRPMDARTSALGLCALPTHFASTHRRTPTATANVLTPRVAPTKRPTARALPPHPAPYRCNSHSDAPCASPAHATVRALCKPTLLE